MKVTATAVDAAVTQPAKIGFKRKTRAYVALTKPRIVELLLVATVPPMILAERGLPDLWLVIGTVIGGALAAGAAGAFNCYYDRDIDRVMRRTKNRPLVTGELTDREALVFSWVLSVISVVWLALVANLLTAGLALGGILLYAGFYTVILKRRTEQNIIWGGIAGCMPVLIGWAAVTNSLSWEPFILFTVIFLWTPPHYWPLAMKYRDDYKAVHVPMISVIRQQSTIGLQVILYTWATVACSVLLVPVAGMGWIYLVGASVAGVWFIYESHLLYSQAIRHVLDSPMRLFHVSISYLTVLFLAVAIDPLIFLPLA